MIAREQEWENMDNDDFDRRGERERSEHERAGDRYDDTYVPERRSRYDDRDKYDDRDQFDDRGRYDRYDRYERPRYDDRPRRYDDRRAPPRAPPSRPSPAPSNIIGAFGLSIRTTERDLEDEFGRIGPVEKVVIVYDARTGRSRGFGFITMKDVETATEAIQALNGIDLHGRRIRVDYSSTSRAHDPTPGEYRGNPRPADDRRGRGPPRGDSYRGDSYRGDSFRGDSYRGGSYRGDSFRQGYRDSFRDSFRGDSFRGDSFRGDSYRGSAYRGDSFRRRDDRPRYPRGYGPDGPDWRRRPSPPPRERSRSPPRYRDDRWGYDRGSRDYERSPPPPVDRYPDERRDYTPPRDDY